MKQYIYTPQEIGLTKFSDGTLRLNCEETRNPDEADVFVCPEALFNFTGKQDLHRFPYMTYRGNTEFADGVQFSRERQHVFFDLSEHFTTYDHRHCIFIRAALTKAMREFGPNSISWPWPAKDYADCIEPPHGGFKYDVTFHGWLSGLARKVSVKACQNSGLQTYIRTYNNFFGHQSEAEQASRAQQYRTGLRTSRMALVQESIPGVPPYRFYEAMSAGRCQLYVGKGYTLPFAKEIDYHQFVSFLNYDDADDAALAVGEWIGRYSDEDLIKKGRKARAAWERWLQPDNWVALMTYAVEQKIASYKEVSVESSGS